MINKLFTVMWLIGVLLTSCRFTKSDKKERDNSASNQLQKLNFQLEKFIAYQGRWSDDVVIQMKKKFKTDSVNMNRFIQLKKRTIGLMKRVNKLKGAIEKTAGHGINPHTHSILTPLEVKEVERYMITEKQAYHLEKSLNAYVHFLNDAYKQYGIPRLPLIAAGNAKNPLYEHQPAKQKLDFAHAYFAQTTAIMALSYLTHFQNMVLRYEEEVIKYMILSLVDKG